MNFLNCCAAGDHTSVATALASGLSPNSADYDNRTGLMLACHNGHESVARALLEAGADPVFKDNFGGTAMLDAVKVRRVPGGSVWFGASRAAAGGPFADPCARALCPHPQMGQDKLIDLMLEFGGSLGMDGVVIATQLCDFAQRGEAALWCMAPATPLVWWVGAQRPDTTRPARRHARREHR